MSPSLGATSPALAGGAHFVCSFYTILESGLLSVVEVEGGVF